MPKLPVSHSLHHSALIVVSVWIEPLAVALSACDQTHNTYNQISESINQPLTLNALCDRHSRRNCLM